jgi:hypothetical protein
VIPGLLELIRARLENETTDLKVAQSFDLRVLFLAQSESLPVLLHGLLGAAALHVQVAELQALPCLASVLLFGFLPAHLVKLLELHLEDRVVLDANLSPHVFRLVKVALCVLEVTMAVADFATDLIVDRVELIADEGHEEPHFRMQVVENHLENRAQEL